jgi:hypothetical protein
VLIHSRSFGGPEYHRLLISRQVETWCLRKLKRDTASKRSTQQRDRLTSEKAIGVGVRKQCHMSGALGNWEYRGEHRDNLTQVLKVSEVQPETL